MTPRAPGDDGLEDGADDADFPADEIPANQLRGDEPLIEEWEDEDNPDPYRAGDDIGGQAGEIDFATSRSIQDEVDEHMEIDAEIDAARAAVKDDAQTQQRARQVVADAQLRYQFDALRTAAYVLVSSGTGPVGRAVHAAVVELLGSQDINIQHSGPSRFPASDGVQYERYYRVVSGTGGPPNARSVHQALSLVRDSQESGAAPKATVKARTDQLSGIAREVESRIAKAERLELGLRHVNDRRVIALRRRIEDTETFVLKVLALARDTAARTASDRLDAMVRDLQTVTERLQHESDDAWKLAGEEEAQRKLVEAELRSQRALHEHEIARAVSEVRRQMSASAPGHDRESFIQSVLPEVCFLKDSIALMLYQMKTPHWLQVLFLLVRDEGHFHETYKGKLAKVQSRKGWWEFNGIRNNKVMERMYFTKDRPDLCAKPGKWAVQLAIKRNQADQDLTIAGLP